MQMKMLGIAAHMDLVLEKIKFHSKNKFEPVHDISNNVAF